MYLIAALKQSRCSIRRHLHDKYKSMWTVSILWDVWCPNHTFSVHILLDIHSSLIQLMEEVMAPPVAG